MRDSRETETSSDKKKKKNILDWVGFLEASSKHFQVYRYFKNRKCLWAWGGALPSAPVGTPHGCRPGLARSIWRGNGVLLRKSLAWPGTSLRRWGIQLANTEPYGLPSYYPPNINSSHRKLLDGKTLRNTFRKRLHSHPAGHTSKLHSSPSTSGMLLTRPSFLGSLPRAIRCSGPQSASMTLMDHSSECMYTHICIHIQAYSTST